MEDSAIIELFFARSEQAIVELEEKYGYVCKKVSANILNSERDVEECVNDAYLATWNTIPPKNPEHLLGYVCKLVRNLSLKRYHSNTAQKRNRFYDVTLDEFAECISEKKTIEEEVLVKELSQQINEFLASLGQKDRILFVRRYWYGDSVSEIGKYVHMRSNHVSVRLSRVREKLRQYLRKEGLIL